MQIPITKIDSKQISGANKAVSGKQVEANVDAKNNFLQLLTDLELVEEQKSPTDALLHQSSDKSNGKKISPENIIASSKVSQSQKLAIDDLPTSRLGKVLTAKEGVFSQSKTPVTTKGENVEGVITKNAWEVSADPIKNQQALLRMVSGNSQNQNKKIVDTENFLQMKGIKPTSGKQTDVKHFFDAIESGKNNIFKTSPKIVMTDKLEKEDLVPIERKIVDRSDDNLVSLMKNNLFNQQLDRGVNNKLDVPVLDLSRIDITQNQQALIDDIAKYLSTQNIKTPDSVEMIVKQDQLGNFHLQVSTDSKNANEVMVRITASTTAGQEFFQQNEIKLQQALATAGVRVSALQIHSGQEMMFSKSGENGFDRGYFFQEHSQQFSSNNQQRSDNADSERRRELWEQYQERRSA